MKQEKGIDAVNQEFKKYEQVNKGQTYHLAEKADEDQFDDEYEIKTCDMALFFKGGEEGKKEFAKQLGEEVRGIGFARLRSQLNGYGIRFDSPLEPQKNWLSCPAGLSYAIRGFIRHFCVAS